MRYIAPLLIFFVLGALAAPAAAWAQPFGPPPRERVQSGQVRSLNDILNDVRRQRPGSLADVQGPDIGPAGEPHYRLKWVSPNGRVEWLDTDARTGRVLGAGPDRGPRVGPNAGPRGGPNAGPPNAGPRLGPRRQDFNPSIGAAPGRAPLGFNRGGFGRGPMPGGGFGRGPGRFGQGGPPGRPGGPGQRFRGR